MNTRKNIRVAVNSYGVIGRRVAEAVCLHQAGLKFIVQGDEVYYAHG
jgi:glyceraldehyde-3-phosphate dehydrogenase/erythrose-4-phosphate dehydrogenase